MPGRHTHVAVGTRAPGVVAAALDAFCQAEAVPPDVAWRLQVALDEIVANVVTHGAAGGAGPVELDVWFSRDGAMVEVTVCDSGPAFDPLARPAPDVSLPLDAREPGGLGIALVRSLMDDVTYERTSGNRLTLRKRIDDHPAEQP